MNKYTDKLEEGCFYHLYNRAIGNELLFYNDNNYEYFLKNIYLYLNNYVDFYVFCLIPNHFHFLIRVKDNSLSNNIATSNNIPIEEAFRRFFITYSQAINKQINRKGSLFMRPYKRIKINDEKYLTSLIHYIHFNPLHHKISNNIIDYKWSSYKIIVNSKTTSLKRDDVLHFFDDKINFEYCHKINRDESLIEHLIIE